MACMESYHRIAMLTRLSLGFIALKSSFGRKMFSAIQVFHLGPTICKLCYVFIKSKRCIFKTTLQVVQCNNSCDAMTITPQVFHSTANHEFGDVTDWYSELRLQRTRLYHGPQTITTSSQHLIISSRVHIHFTWFYTIIQFIAQVRSHLHTWHHLGVDHLHTWHHLGV